MGHVLAILFLALGAEHLMALAEALGLVGETTIVVSKAHIEDVWYEGRVEDDKAAQLEWETCGPETAGGIGRW